MVDRAVHTYFPVLPGSVLDPPDMQRWIFEEFQRIAAAMARPRVMIWQVFEDATDVASGDGASQFPVTTSLAGYRLVFVHAYVKTAGTTGTTDIQIYNVTTANDMLSTKLTIDSGETSSRTAATPAVIDVANSRMSAGDIIRFDIDAVSSTAPKGLWIEFEFGQAEHAR